MSLPERIHEIETVIAEMQRAATERDGDFAALALMVKGISDRIDSDSGDSNLKVFKDQWWCCLKCETKLGIYDRDADELRLRMRGNGEAFMRPGPGGIIRVLCRGCSYINELVSDSEEEQVKDTVVSGG